MGTPPGCTSKGGASLLPRGIPSGQRPLLRPRRFPGAGQLVQDLEEEVAGPVAVAGLFRRLEAGRAEVLVEVVVAQFRGATRAAAAVAVRGIGGAGDAGMAGEVEDVGGQRPGRRQ